MTFDERFRTQTRLQNIGVEKTSFQIKMPRPGLTSALMANIGTSNLEKFTNLESLMKSHPVLAIVDTQMALGTQQTCVRV